MTFRGPCQIVKVNLLWDLLSSILASVDMHLLYGSECIIYICVQIKLLHFPLRFSSFVSDLLYNCRVSHLHVILLNLNFHFYTVCIHSIYFFMYKSLPMCFSMNLHATCMQKGTCFLPFLFCHILIRVEEFLEILKIIHSSIWIHYTFSASVIYHSPKVDEETALPSIYWAAASYNSVRII